MIHHEPLSNTSSDASQWSIENSQTSNCRDSVSSSDVMRRESVSSFGDRKISSNAPIIDLKPIEFWTSKHQTVQPKGRRLISESDISLDDFKIDLYESIEYEESLTDEEKLARFNLGQVHFAINYDLDNKNLIVRIIEARGLPMPCLLDNKLSDLIHSNPYAKISILPYNKDSQKTTLQRKTQNPKWNEEFSFNISIWEAQRSTLDITLKDFDKYSRNCIIGQVLVPLSSLLLVKGVHLWKTLHPFTQENPDLGEILFSLNYLPSARRLNVDIIKAKQLLQTEIEGKADPYVRLNMVHENKNLKSRKSSIMRNTINPVYNEQFNFNILSLDVLKESSLVISVWNHHAGVRDAFMGRVVLGKNSSGQYETNHWNRMLQCHRQPAAQWHTLKTREECDNISIASSSISQ